MLTANYQLRRVGTVPIEDNPGETRARSRCVHIYPSLFFLLLLRRPTSRVERQDINVGQTTHPKWQLNIPCANWQLRRRGDSLFQDDRDQRRRACPLRFVQRVLVRAPDCISTSSFRRSRKFTPSLSNSEPTETDSHSLSLSTFLPFVPVRSRVSGHHSYYNNKS